MIDVPCQTRVEAIESLQSTIKKSEKAMAQMTRKGASTTLIERRLHALRVGLAMLENAWALEPHPYTREDLAQAREVLVGLGPSIQSVYAKSGTRSPQRTLLERRINALELAVQAIDDVLDA